MSNHSPLRNENCRKFDQLSIEFLGKLRHLLNSKIKTFNFCVTVFCCSIHSELNLMVVVYRIFLTSLSLIVIISLCVTSPVWAESNNSASNIFERALDRLRHQDYQQALVEFTKVIDYQDNLVDAAYSNRCLVYLQLQNYSAAEADCVTAIEHNHDNIEAHLNLGLAYYLREEYNSAISEYRRVIQQNSHDYRAYYNLGLAHFALEDYQQAVKDYNSALKSSDSMTSQQKTLIYNDRALAYMMLGDYKLAIADTDQVIILEDRNYSAYFNRGCAHHRQGNYLAAIDDFTEVIQLKPDLTQAYVNRAMLHHRIGNENAALVDLEIALQQYQRQDISAYHRVFNLKQKLFYSQPNQLG